MPTDLVSGGAVGAPQVADSWLAPLRSVCAEACPEVAGTPTAEIVLFYLARWCQKQTCRDEPDARLMPAKDLLDAARAIARNLEADGDRVDRLVAGDAADWTQLRTLLEWSAVKLVGRAAAPEYIDEALQKIALVLLTGASPSGAQEQLRTGVVGPGNEYDFTAPFTPWARLLVIRSIVDDLRRSSRQRQLESADLQAPAAQRAGRAPRRARATSPLSSAVLREAIAVLPELLAAIGALPREQRRVMTYSLCRSELDEDARDHLRRLAPDLFAEVGDVRVGSDDEIADALGSERRRVAANRSVARRRLAAQDARWALLLDVLLPHRSTRRGDDEEAPHA